MQSLIALQQSVVTDQVMHLPQPLVLPDILIYAAIFVLGGGIVLGLLLAILGAAFGARLSAGAAIGAMILFMLVALGVTFGLAYAGMINSNDLEAAMNYGQMALAMPYGFRTFLYSIAAAFVVLVLVVVGTARDAQGDRAALGSVLFVCIIMAALGAAAFYGINYGVERFAPQYAIPELI